MTPSDSAEFCCFCDTFHSSIYFFFFSSLPRKEKVPLPTRRPPSPGATCPAHLWIISFSGGETEVPHPCWSRRVGRRSRLDLFASKPRWLRSSLSSLRLLHQTGPRLLAASIKSGLRDILIFPPSLYCCFFPPLQ